MVCFHPIKAFYPLHADEQGKRYLLFGRKRYNIGWTSSQYLWMYQVNDEFQDWNPSIFNPQLYDSPYDFPIYYNNDGDICGFNIKVPCGKCIGCRLDYSRMWATRSVHEAYINNYYQDCSFLTLTFNDDMLSRRTNPNSLNRSAFTSWIKRLRKAIKCNYDKEIRLMACGEYGSKHKRPHYHILIYGFNFPDKYVFKYNKIRGKEVLYYRSPFLEKIWKPAYSDEPYGFSVIGDVNFESSAYVARYVTKKLFGPYADKVYKDKEKEFLTTSRMPGLGYGYLTRFYKNIFDLGYIVLPNGHKAPIPRYYENKLQEIDPEIYYKYMISKKEKFVNNLFIENIDSTKERLIVREELKKMNLDLLVRQYEF